MNKQLKFDDDDLVCDVGNDIVASVELHKKVYQTTRAIVWHALKTALFEYGPTEMDHYDFIAMAVKTYANADQQEKISEHERMLCAAGINAMEEEMKEYVLGKQSFSDFKTVVEAVIHAYAISKIISLSSLPPHSTPNPPSTSLQPIKPIYASAKTSDSISPLKKDASVPSMSSEGHFTSNDAPESWMRSPWARKRMARDGDTPDYEYPTQAEIDRAAFKKPKASSGRPLTGFLKYCDDLRRRSEAQDLAESKHHYDS